MAWLLALSVSPWSEKARWALDHGGVAYREVEHVPLVGEPALRLLARRPFGKVTVPIFVARDGVRTESFAIARHAAPALFPPDADNAVAAWNARSDRVMAAGRVRMIARLAASRDALAESLPPVVPRALRPALAPVAGLVVGFLARKHGAAATDAESRAATIADELAALRAGLARAGGDYLLGTFSYADVAMAAALQFVSPVAERYIRLGDATRACWTDADLAATFADLLAWRDRLYARHR